MLHCQVKSYARMRPLLSLNHRKLKRSKIKKALLISKRTHRLKDKILHRAEKIVSINPMAVNYCSKINLVILDMKVIPHMVILEKVKAILEKTVPTLPIETTITSVGGVTSAIITVDTNMGPMEVRTMKETPDTPILNCSRQIS